VAGETEKGRGNDYVKLAFTAQKWQGNSVSRIIPTTILHL